MAEPNSRPCGNEEKSGRIFSRFLRNPKHNGRLEKSGQKGFHLCFSAIKTHAKRIFLSGKVPIFWPEGSGVNERSHSRKRIRAALKRFLDEKALITDVCLLSGDSDFQAAVERLQQSGRNIIVSLISNDSLSPDLLASADEFWDFPREPAPH